MRTDDARTVLEAARAEAAALGKAVTVAVVDAAGMLVLLERLADAPGFSAFVAEGKACASAFTGRDSGALEAMVANYPAMAASLAGRLGSRFVPIQGAVVLRGPGGIAGAIGVSGASAGEDERIARAGAAAFPG